MKSLVTLLGFLVTSRPNHVQNSNEFHRTAALYHFPLTPLFDYYTKKIEPSHWVSWCVISIMQTFFITLDPGIDPYVYLFEFFSRPYGLIREYINVDHLDGCLLHRKCVFNALRLFFLTNFPVQRLFQRLE